VKKRASIFIIGLLMISTFLLIPGTAHSIYFGKGAIKQAQPEFALGRLIVKLKPEVDKKVILDQVQGIVTTGLAEFDQLNARFSVKKQEKLFKDFVVVTDFRGERKSGRGKDAGPLICHRGL